MGQRTKRGTIKRKNSISLNAGHKNKLKGNKFSSNAVCSEMWYAWQCVNIGFMRTTFLLQRIYVMLNDKLVRFRSCWVTKEQEKIWFILGNT